MVPRKFSIKSSQSFKSKNLKKSEIFYIIYIEDKGLRKNLIPSSQDDAEVSNQGS